MSLRVTGGRFAGRRLRVPRGGLRPTADRVRESLFARLGDLEGAAVLDLFAGTGALGIEALSRGAASLVSVERARGAAAVLRANVSALRLTSSARVMVADVALALHRLGRAGERFDLVLADPPYASGEAQRALEALVAAEVLAAGAVVVLERRCGHPPPSVTGLAPLDERRYGDTVITRFTAPAPGGGREVGTNGRDEQWSRRSRDEGRRIDQRMTKAVRKPTLALIPASFDPVTNGHLDIIHRSRAIFERLIVAAAVNVEKGGLFTAEERVELLRDAVEGLDGIDVTSFNGLTTDFAREIGANVIIRGVRAMSDFEYEFEMALMNKHLYPEIETVFMMASQEYLYVSSSRLKELVQFGRDVSEFVPKAVAEKLKERIGRA